MPHGSVAGIPVVFRHRPLDATHHLFFAKRFKFYRALYLAMGSEGPSRRPFCLKCFKAASTCICSRLPSTPLDNSISVTILLHSLEKKHPLNSTRIAKLGLKNLEIVPVTDVNFHAQLVLRPLEPSMVAQMKPEGSLNFSDAKCCNGCRSAHSFNPQNPLERQVSDPSFTYHKQTPISSMLQRDFDLQRKELQPSKKLEDFDEFDIAIPPGAALLFPSDKAISLKEVDFEVKHLVVLDGTWAKAKRIYHENPWLQLLPHLKLDSGRESLYAEVRHEPKAGCFSTIESIVCAMKELGGAMEGLDKLLDVFRSMVDDQRVCCKDKIKDSVLETVSEP
ncbi:uncharacterized protein LOC121971281 isoform X2 [Zingiber officinale]|uniref:uncharacterized protein LOC121971281 isoform X2 n=1 Tax=Zingiber officinale TaxID=94328 RepID=UPI001C4CFB1E|nr:uncharacterized protein LOC121971281 isoform X2 [Zingiber officinale]